MLAIGSTSPTAEVETLLAFIQRNEHMQSSDGFGSVALGVNKSGEADAARYGVEMNNGVMEPAKESRTRSDGDKKRLAVELANFDAMAKEARSKLLPGGSFADRAAQVYQVAQQLFAAAPTWMAFYRELLSTTGVARTLYPDATEYRQFETTSEFSEVQKMITVLRAGNLPENDPMESQRMITVRLPLSLHQALCQEADERGVSVNQLCISRLLQMVADDYIPNSSKGRRGRRPGPQGPRRDRNAQAEEQAVVEARVFKGDGSIG